MESSRRNMIKLTAAAGAAAIVVPGCASGARTMASNDVSLNDAGDGVFEAPSSLVGAGEGSIERVRSDEVVDVLVFRTQDGEVRVLNGTCPHFGCAVGFYDESRVQCGCHGSEWTLDGTVIEGPANQDLARYAATEQDGMIRINLREIIPTETES